MASITVKGVNYPLRLDLNAMEKIEKEFGGLKEAMEGCKKAPTTNSMRLFVILANSARRKEGKPQDITDDCIRDARIKTLQDLGKAIEEAFAEAMESETIKGPADDEERDEYLEEYNKKNA